MRGDNVRLLMWLALVVSACAGRSPNPVAVTQPTDHLADCAQIKAEILANNKRLQELADEEGLKLAQNMAAGTLGVFTLGLGWLALDAQGTAKVEGQAISARNQYLGSIATERCKTPGGTPQPQ
jgi:hypothetical protein